MDCVVSCPKVVLFRASLLLLHFPAELWYWSWVSLLYVVLIDFHSFILGFEVMDLPDNQNDLVIFLFFIFSLLDLSWEMENKNGLSERIVLRMGFLGECLTESEKRT